MLGWGEESKANYEGIYNGGPNDPNKASWTHEAFGAAAGFGAMKIYEDRQRAEGKPVSHAFAKEALAGLAAAEVDRLAETSGADFVDREMAKRKAKEQVHTMYDQQYGSQDQYDPNTTDNPFPPDNSDN